MREFTTESRIKATRKDHSCICCHTIIPAASQAIAFATKNDGEFHHGHMHRDCRDAEIAWNHEADTWGEDWQPLDSIKDCDDAEEWCAWLAEKWPVVAARVGVRGNA
jgi:hypothetical protein